MDKTESLRCTWHLPSGMCIYSMCKQEPVCVCKHWSAGLKSSHAVYSTI